MFKNSVEGCVVEQEVGKESGKEPKKERKKEKKEPRKRAQDEMGDLAMQRKKKGTHEQERIN